MTNYTIVGDDTGSGSSSSLSAGLITAIVLALVLFISVIASLLTFVCADRLRGCRRRRRHSGAAAPDAVLPQAARPSGGTARPLAPRIITDALELAVPRHSGEARTPSSAATSAFSAAPLLPTPSRASHLTGEEPDEFGGGPVL